MESLTHRIIQSATSLPSSTLRTPRRTRLAAMATPRLRYSPSRQFMGVAGGTRLLDVSRRKLLSRQSRCQAAFDEELEEVDSAVLVVGGGGLGMEAVRALVDADILVAAYQREEKFDIPEMFHDDIEEMGWDVIDVATIEKVLEAAPFKAIVCTVGGGVRRRDFDRDVPIKLVYAAKVAGVTRFILVSSIIGAGGSLKGVDEKTVEEAAEEAVKSSKLDYTIIRPGELSSDPSTGNGILTEKSDVAGLISRADLAALIVKVLFNEKSYGKILTAIDQDKLIPPTASLNGVELMSL